MILKGAYIEFKDKAPIKTHNLDDLFVHAGFESPKSHWVKELAEITRHFWRVRYPDFREHVYTSRRKVEPIIKISKEIYLWVKEKLITT